jgi:hypothetical protein
MPSNSLRTDATRAPVLFHHEHQLSTKKFKKICACRCNSSQNQQRNALHSYAMEQNQILSGCFNCGRCCHKRLLHHVHDAQLKGDLDRQGSFFLKLDHAG